MSDYALKGQISILEYQMKQYVHITALQKLEDKIDPVFSQCAETLKQCVDHNTDMRAAIVDFDRVISTKAERFNLQEMRKWCGETFLPIAFIAKTEKELSEQKAYLIQSTAEIRGEVSDVKQEFNSQIQHVVSTSLDRRMRHYENVT